MKKLHAILLLIGSFHAQADYRGMIVAHVVEPNGHVYRGYDGFESGGVFKGKQVIDFEQERGQKVSLKPNGLVFDKSTSKKYRMIFEITDKSQEQFQADIEFFENKLEFDTKTEKYLVNSILIKKTSVVGTLHSENEYVLVNDEQPNFRLSINIDKIFTKEELAKRFSAKLENPKPQ